MERTKKRLVRAGLLAGVAALAVAGAMWPADASPTPTAPSAAAQAGLDFNAPLGDEVAGVRRGAQVPNNAPADIARFRAAHEAMLGSHHSNRAAKPGASTIHPAQGTALLDTDGADGASATQSIAPDLAVKDPGSTVYVPTLYPPGGSCIEVSTRYVKGAKEVAAWDWCGSINFAASVPIDQNFVAKYTKADNAYRVQVVQTDSSANTWTASLYNYQTNAWDKLFSSSGSTQAGNGGWDIYELYSEIDTSSGRSYVCGDLNGKSFEASDIKVRNGSGWTAANSDNADTHYDQPAENFKCPSLQYQMVNDYDHWQATG